MGNMGCTISHTQSEIKQCDDLPRSKANALLQRMVQDVSLLDAVSYSLLHNSTAARIYNHDRSLISPPNLPHSQATMLQQESCRRISDQNSKDMMNLKKINLRSSEIFDNLAFANALEEVDLADVLSLISNTSTPDQYPRISDDDSPLAALKFLLQHERTLSHHEREFLKIRTHRLNLTLNGRYCSKIVRQPASILLRIDAETKHLSPHLSSLRLAKLIDQTMLIITIDSPMVFDILNQIAFENNFMCTQIFLHSKTKSKELYNISVHDDNRIIRENLHVLYGLRLALLELNFTYVITMESDVIVSEDFLEFHLHLSQYSFHHQHVLAVNSFPEGLHHDCFWMTDKLQGDGVCPANDPAILFASRYISGHAPGLTRKSLSILHSMTDFGSMRYDTMLRLLMLNRSLSYYTLSPCKPRIKRLQVPHQEGYSATEAWDNAVSIEAGGSKFFAYKILFPEEDNATGVETDHLVTPEMGLTEDEARDRLQLSLMPHSAHRCVGVDWWSRSCHFRHLCFEPHAADATVLTSGEFVYFSDPSLSHIYNAIPFSVALNSGVAAGAEGYGPRWAPRVVEGQIPGDVELVRGGPFVLLTEYNFANPMLVLADYYLPWFLLLGLFGFDDDPPTSAALRSGLRQPLDSSCQYMHRELCDKMAALLFPGGRPALLSDLPFFDLDAAHQMTGEGRLLCFENVLAGTGRLNDHCNDEYLHGREAWSQPHANTYCSVGRAPQMRQFRSLILQRLGVVQPGRSEQRVLVMGKFMVLDNSDDPAGFLAQYPAIRALLQGRGLHAIEADFPALPLKEQAALVCAAEAYLGICGGGASMLGMLMRPGSFMFLSCSAMLDHEPLLNHGLAQPVYFGRADAPAVAAMVWDTLQALGHF